MSKELEKKEADKKIVEISGDKNERVPWYKKVLAKKVFIPVLSLIVLLFAGSVGAAYYFDKTGKFSRSLRTDIKQNEPKKVDKNAGKIETPIDGVYREARVANSLPYAIMIENLSTVRPQSALGKANLVFEALAEGGITRFMAVFVGQSFDQAGPVRSARRYYLDWAEEFHGLYAHAGGSPEALQAIPGFDFTDLNGISSDGVFFWRDRSRSAPHNLFTKSELLLRAQTGKKAGETGNYDAWNFEDEQSQDGENAEDAIDSQENAAESNKTTGKSAELITIDFSSASYQVKWQFDSEKNEYLRTNGGASHTDRLTGEQIRAKNIVIARLKTTARPDGRLSMDTLSGGESIVLRDGVAIEGTWKKPTSDDRMRFYDNDGKEVVFNRVTSWIEIVPTDRNVSY